MIQQAIDCYPKDKDIAKGFYCDFNFDFATIAIPPDYVPLSYQYQNGQGASFYLKNSITIGELLIAIFLGAFIAFFVSKWIIDFFFGQKVRIKRKESVL